MSYLNPDNRNPYVCTNPVLVGVDLPTSTEKVWDTKYLKTTGEQRYVNPHYLHTRNGAVLAPCRHCDNCRKLQSRQWQGRLSWHQLSHKKSYSNGHTYFVTLSFDDFHLPTHESGSNSSELATYSLVQSFIRQLRDGIKGVYSKSGNEFSGSLKYDYLAPLSFDYYVVGEFGDEYKRFHYHILLYINDDRLIPDYFYHLPDGSTLNSVNELKYGVKRYPPSSANPEGLPLKLTYINSGKKSYKKNAKHRRLQTGKEATLQYLLSQRWKCGIVSVGSPDNNGGFGYVSSYSTSSYYDYKEGFCSFHRQSLGIGAEWFLKWSNVIYSGEVHTFQLDPLSSKYGVVPIPSYYLKKFGNEESRINYFNTTYDSRLKQNIRYLISLGIEPRQTNSYNLITFNTQFDNERIKWNLF